MDTTIRTAQVLSLTSSLVLSGINIGSSLLTIPMLYTRPVSITAPIFSEFYHRGLVTVVPLNLFSASCSALVAYLFPAQRSLWAIAGGVTVSQLPWTGLVMSSTNSRLNSVAASQIEQEKISQEEVVGLLKQWYWMNLLRGSLALAGGLVGVYALIEGKN